MKWIFKNFRKKDIGESRDKKAIVFVDFEHWYYSYQRLYHLKPDPVEWRKELEENYQIEDIMVFADFSHKGIREELSKVRCITNTIIETQQTFAHYKKDMTDFIMLDYIYQYENDHPGTNTYIIFTGDGHFQSVVKYLTQKHQKEVLVYGVKDAFSSRLKTAASRIVELPAATDTLKGFYPLIIKNLSYVTDKPDIIPTFSGTAKAVSLRNEIPEELVKAALAEMIEKGLVYKRQQRVEFNKSVKVVAANWDALAKAGLWSFSE